VQVKAILQCCYNFEGNYCYNKEEEIGKLHQLKEKRADELTAV